MNGYGITDIGLKRQNNEDALYVSNDGIGTLPNLYIVSDGMGGHNAGEVASERSIAFFCEAVTEMCAWYAIEDGIPDILVTSIKAANEKVFRFAQQNASYCGMGATFLACVIADDKVYAAHVGDSRAYIIQDGTIRQITTDHSFVNEMIKVGELTPEQARQHPRRNMITRAIGTAAAVDVDCVIESFTGDATLLICSDGLSDRVSEDDMLRIITADGLVAEKAKILTELAKQNGGDDNISTVLVSLNEVRE